MTASTEKQGARSGRRWLKRLTILLLALIVLVIGLIGLAPRLVPAFVAAQYVSESGGVVEASGLRFRWFDGQRIGNIRLRDPQGAQVADLSLDLPVRLIDVALGQRQIEPIHIRGNVDLIRHADRTLNIARVFVSDAPPTPKPTPRPTPPTEPRPEPQPPVPAEIELPGPWGGSLDFSGLTISYSDEADPQLGAITLALRQGLFSYNPIAGVTIEIEADISPSGSLSINSRTTHFAGSDFVVRPEEVRLETKVHAADIPVGLIDAIAGADGLIAALAGDLLQLNIDMTGGLGEAAVVGALKSPGVTGDVNIAWREGMIAAAPGAELFALRSTVRNELLHTLAAEQPLRIAGREPDVRLTIRDVAVPFSLDKPLDLRAARGEFLFELDPAEFDTGTEFVERLSLSGLRAQASTTALAEGLHLQASGDVSADGQEGGAIAVDVALTDLFDAQGALSPARAMAQGEASLRNWPTAILEPLLAGLGIDAGRDIGPTLDIAFTASRSLAVDDEEAETDLALSVQAAKVQARAAAVLTGASIRSGAEPTTLRAQLPAAMLAGYIPAEAGWNLAQAGTLDVAIESFDLPMDFADANAPFRLAAAVSLAGQRLTQANGKHVGIPGLQLSVSQTDSPGQQRLLIDGSLDVNGELGSLSGEITLDDPQAALAGEKPWQDMVLALRPAGAVNVRGMDLTPLLADLPEELPIDDLLGGPLTLALRTEPGEAILRVETELSTRTLRGSAKAGLSRDALTAESVNLATTLAPEAISAIIAAYVPEAEGAGQEGAGEAEVGAHDEPDWSPRQLAFLDPLPLELTVHPWRMDLSADAGERPPLRATVSTPSAFRVSGLPADLETISLAHLRLDADVAFAGEEIEPTLKLAAALDRAESAQRLALIEGTLHSLLDDSAKIDVIVKEIDVAQVEGLLKQEPGLLVGLLGPSGEVTASLDHAEGRQAIVAGLDLPRLRGRLAGALDGEILELTEPAFLSIEIAPELLTQTMTMLLEEPAGEKKDKAAKPKAPPLTFERATTATLNVRALRINIANPLDPTALTADVTAGADQIQGSALGATPFAYRDVKLALATEGEGGASKRLRTSLTGYSIDQSPDAPRPAIDIHLAASDLFNEANEISPDNAKLTGSLRIEDLSMALVDSLAGLRGILESALGTSATAEVQLDGFSRDSGTLAANFNSDFGELRASGAAHEGVFALDRPLTASLVVSEAFSNLVLRDLIPIYELRKTPEDGPAVLTLTDFRFPLDGDMGRLNGTLNLDLGRATYVLRDPINTIVAFADGDVRGDIRQVIPPVEMTITDGVVRYSDLPVIVNRTQMNFSGRINLGDRRIRLRTEIPFGELDTGILRSVGGIGRLRDLVPPDTMFPIVIRGTIAEPTLDVEAGLKQLQENVGRGLLERGAEDALRRLFDR